MRTEHSVMYPDVAVTYAPVPPKDDLLPDPVVIAEVLSPSTESFDRGPKTEAYRWMASLRHLLLISQDRCEIDMYTRDGDGWRLMRYDRMEQQLPLTAIGVAVPVAEIYRSSSVV